MQRLCVNGRRPLGQRAALVENVEAAAMCRDDEVLRAPLNVEIHVERRRQVRAELCTVRARIARDVWMVLRAEEDDSRLAAVFTDEADAALPRQTPPARRPCPCALRPAADRSRSPSMSCRSRSCETRKAPDPRADGCRRRRTPCRETRSMPRCG